MIESLNPLFAKIVAENPDEYDTHTLADLALAEISDREGALLYLLSNAFSSYLSRHVHDNPEETDTVRPDFIHTNPDGTINDGPPVRPGKVRSGVTRGRSVLAAFEARGIHVPALGRGFIPLGEMRAEYWLSIADDREGRAGKMLRRAVVFRTIAETQNEQNAETFRDLLESTRLDLMKQITETDDADD
jgi:hypothetical protein